MDSHIFEPFLVREKIGSGAFSNVFLAEHPASQAKIAIKEVHIKDSGNDEKMKTHLVREINFIKAASSNYIIQLFDVIESSDRVFLLFEYAENGNLGQFIRRRGPLEGENLRLAAAQITVMLNYLHNTMKIVHRDIKAENVLFDKNWNLKLADFGLCVSYYNGAEDFNSICGSLQYMAPEIIKNKQYNRSIDIWSAGVLFFYMATGHFPFEEISMQLLLNKITAYEPNYPTNLDKNLLDLIQKMLIKNPQKRIKAEEMLNHPYFMDFNMEKINGDLPEVLDDQIIKLAKERSYDPENDLVEHKNLIFKVLKKEIQNNALKNLREAPKETKKSPDSRKSLSLSIKQPDPIKEMAKKYVHGHRFNKRQRTSLNLIQNTQPKAALTKQTLEMST